MVRERAVRVEPRDGYRIWIEFEDGASGELDLSDSAFGVFAAWQDRAVFETVRIKTNPYRAVTWGDDLEMCEDALYVRLTGDPYELRLLAGIGSSPMVLELIDWRASRLGGSHPSDLEATLLTPDRAGT